MTRDRLIADVREILGKTGFYLSERHGERGLCFDFVARRDDLLLVVKVLQNVDALTKETADELRVIARTLRAGPVVVGERSGGGSLEEGIVYSRFGVPIVSRRTFSDFFEEGVPPFIYSAPGGIYVKLDTDLLRRARGEEQFSLGRLAEIAGVSRRTIQMYLDGMSASIEVAKRLEEFLEEPVVLPADPFSYVEEPPLPTPPVSTLETLERELFDRLKRLGYDVLPTLRSPFDAFTQHADTTLLTGVERADASIDRKAEVMSNIGRVVERDAVMFVEKRTIRMSIRGLPVIAREELKKARNRDAVEDLIAERKG